MKTHFPKKWPPLETKKLTALNEENCEEHLGVIWHKTRMVPDQKKTT